LSDAAFTISAPPGSANNMYVWDQSWSVSQRGSWITVSVTVSVKRDTNANNIAEASDGPASGPVMNYVMDHFSSGVLIASTTFTNAKVNSNGQVTFNLKTLFGGDFRDTVTALSKSGLTWVRTLDHENPSYYKGAPGGGEVPGFLVISATSDETSVPGHSAT